MIATTTQARQQARAGPWPFAAVAIAEPPSAFSSAARHRPVLVDRAAPAGPFP
ncbi:MAG: hypothetical protein M0030_24690 [Actinomycetota bacterium]|nr:hypothetical protein [Actinomycetota bacterium]